MLIIGIDPGYAITGYGVIEYKGNSFKVIDYGAITTHASENLHSRLLKLDTELGIIFDKYKPDFVSVEELFFNKNIKTALAAAHGRGIALLAAAKSGSGVFEYTPLQVKQAVVGYGRATKQQVQQMVKVLLNLEKTPKPDDVADALAVAICHAHSFKYNAYGM